MSTESHHPSIPARIERSDHGVRLVGVGACEGIFAELDWRAGLRVHFGHERFPHLDLRPGLAPTAASSKPGGERDLFRAFVGAISKRCPNRSGADWRAFRRRVAIEKARFLAALPTDLLKLGRRFGHASRHEVLRLGLRFPGPFTLNAIEASPGVVILAAGARARALDALADGLGDALAKGVQPRRFLRDAWPQVLDYLVTMKSPTTDTGWHPKAVSWLANAPDEAREAAFRFRRWVLGAGTRVSPDHLFDLPPAWVERPRLVLRPHRNAQWYRLMGNALLRATTKANAPEVRSIAQELWRRQARMLCRDGNGNLLGEVVLAESWVLSGEDVELVDLASRVEALLGRDPFAMYDREVDDSALDEPIPLPWPDVSMDDVSIRFLRTQRAIRHEGRSMGHCLRPESQELAMDAFAAATVEGEALTLRVRRDFTGVPKVVEVKGAKNVDPTPRARRRVEEVLRAVGDGVPF